MDHLFSESALAGATIPSGREFEKNHDELTRWQFYVQDDEVMTLEEQVQQLSRSDFNDISLDYDSAVDTEHGSGDHWILMAVLDKYGFRTNSPLKAVELAEEIMTLWHRLHK